jgi:hypothetical protein
MMPAPQMAPPPPPPGPDFSSLERHLFKITSQIEALQRPDHMEQSIAVFRSELAEIRQAITEAMPRRAIESIENEIRSLSRRIDETAAAASTASSFPASSARSAKSARCCSRRNPPSSSQAMTRRSATCTPSST